MAQQWRDDPGLSRAVPPPRVGGAPVADRAVRLTGGLNPKIGGLLAYLLLGWLGAVVLLLTQRHTEVRFHAAQSLLASLAFVTVGVAIGVVASALGAIPGVGLVGAALLSLLYPLLSLGGLGLWVHLCVKGYRLEHYKLPVVGDIAERWVAS